MCITLWLGNQFISSVNESHLKKLVYEICGVVLLIDTVAVVVYCSG